MKLVLHSLVVKMINIRFVSIIFGLYSFPYTIGSVIDNEITDPTNWKFDPDENLNVPQIIRRHGYPSESHIVETEDGYLLTIHRIPGSKAGKKGCQPIFLMHGALMSSADWVDEGNSSLGFLLADDGFDVWLGNARGNIYSTGHTTLDLNSKEFWDFSWHEMGIYDLPAVIEYISNTTGKGGDILYVGHSMGNTMFFVFASLRPQIAKQVKFMTSMAPAVYMKHLNSPMKFLAPFMRDDWWICEHFGINKFLPSNILTKFLINKCKSMDGALICENIMFALFGADKAEYNEDIMPVVEAHLPGGASIKTMLHYGLDIATGGTFQEFDYGIRGNLAHYGATTPPAYNLTNVQVPIYLMYAANDKTASPMDVLKLSKQLKNLVGMYLVPLKKFNHIDFLYGKDALEVVYKPLVEILRKYK